MVRTATAATLVRQRTRALLKALPAALDGDPAALHRARVASRRLRELIPLLEDIPRKAPKRVRKLTRALGRVRELDVALALLDSTEISASSRLGALSARQSVAARREERRARMLARLQKLGTGKLERTLEELIDRAEAQEMAILRRQLGRRIATRVKRLRAAIAEAGALYVPERLHAVRLAAKKLRYAVEIAAELGVKRAASLAAEVRRSQVTLGNLQDRHVLLREVRAASEGESDTLARPALVTLGAEVERQARDLHARFLADRDRLAGALAEVRQRVVMDLVAGSKARSAKAALSGRSGVSARTTARRG